jgi:hypothetical protein
MNPARRLGGEQALLFQRNECLQEDAMTINHRRRWLSSLGAVAFSLLGCGGAPDNSANTGAAPADTITGTINGKLLYSIESKPGQRLDFYDFGDGQTAVHETHRMETDAPVVDAIRAKRPKTLAEIYRLASPGTPVPAILVDADSHAADYSRANPAPASEEATPAPASSVASSPQALTACSGDFYGDNWGAQWFRSNYCDYQPGSDQFWCRTNRWTVDTGDQEHTNFYYYQFEGDFNNQGWTTGTHKHCSFFSCTWIRDWDYWFAPRHVHTWYYGGYGMRRAEGSSQCGHAGLALHQDYP